MKYVYQLPSGTTINLLEISSISKIFYWEPRCVNANSLQVIFKKTSKLLFKYRFSFIVYFTDGEKVYINNHVKKYASEGLTIPESLINLRNDIVEKWDNALQSKYDKGKGKNKRLWKE